MGSDTRSRRKPAATASHDPAPGPHGARFFEDQGVMVVRDLRMFRRGQEAFCRGLAIAAARQEGVRSVRIGLESSTCRIEFAPGRVDAGRMAERFARAVREAVAGPSAGRRDDGRGARWGALAAFPDAEQGASLWEIVREGPGRLGTRHARLRDDPGLARRVAREMRAVPGVLACRLGPVRRDLRITYDPGRLTEFAVADCPEEVLRRLLRPDTNPEPSPPEGDPEPAVASGLRRGYYLVMAGGSFTLTLVGLAVPGFPTIPFLLATSYYLARSSRMLNRRLARSWFFGPILTDLEKHGGLRPINKLKLVGLVLGVGAVTLVLIGPSLSLVLIMAGAGSVSLYAIQRIPDLPSGGGTVPSPAFA